MSTDERELEAAKEAVRSTLSIGGRQFRLTVNEAALVEAAFEGGLADTLVALLTQAVMTGAVHGMGTASPGGAGS